MKDRSRIYSFKAIEIQLDGIYYIDTEDDEIRGNMRVMDVYVNSETKNTTIYLRQMKGGDAVMSSPSLYIKCECDKILVGDRFYQTDVVTNIRLVQDGKTTRVNDAIAHLNRKRNRRAGIQQGHNV